MLKRPNIALPIQPPQVVLREITYPRRDMWILLAVCFFFRLCLSGVNQGEYTDGVLQVLQFVDPTSIWPPLYGALVYPLKFIIGYLWAGRLVTIVMSSLALYPLYRMTQRAFGTRAALYAGIFYITAPVATRWGIRMMSDAPFAMFFWWACERLYFAADERREDLARRAFGMACVFTVLASLTRYQGVMLLPPIVVFAIILRKRFGRWPLKPALWLLGIGLLFAWVYVVPDTFIHDEQFRSRAIEAQSMALGKVLALNGEAFIAYMPYFLTYPVAICVLFGTFWTRQRRGPTFGWLMLFIAVVLLVVQSAFSSFQERYFLPLFGFFWVLAGSGMYALEERWLRHGRVWKKRLFPYVLIGTYLWSLAFTVWVLFAQRQAFGDIAAASRWVAAQTDPATPIYTNELYRSNPPIAANKVSFYAKRPVTFLNEGYVGISDTGVRAPGVTLEPGSIVILSSAYSGEVYERYLRQYYRLTPIGLDENGGTMFVSSIMPLLPDIMSGPSGAQNPIAWYFRYDWQTFSTNVFRVEGPR